METTTKVSNLSDDHASIQEHRVVTHVKKHIHRYWLALYLVFFIAIPISARMLATPTSYYPRIIQSASLWAFSICFSLYGIFASKQAYFRKNVAEFTWKHEIAIILLRILYVVWLAASVYYLAPVMNGVFQKFVLNKPYEIVRDTVIYAQSSGGRYANSEGSCIYMFCQLKLQSEPNRELEYDDAPYIQQGDKYQFVILPGSNLVVGSANL
jgi:signal transduction histidine kinase